MFPENFTSEHVKKIVDYVEFVSVIEGIKPVLLGTVDRRFVPLITSVCGDMEAVCKTKEMGSLTSEKSAGNEDVFISISREGEIIDNLFFHLFGPIKGRPATLGELLGYPDCCVERLTELIPARDSTDFVYETKRNSLSFPFLTNNIYNLDSRLKKEEIVHFQSLARKNVDSEFLSDLFNIKNLHLISHIPCSYDCAKSMQLSKRILKALEKHNQPMSVKIRQILKKPVLFLDTLRFLVFNGKGSRDEILYDSISYPMSFIEKDVLDKIQSGNRLLAEDKHIDVFRDEKHVFRLEKKKIHEGFVLPFR